MAMICADGAVALSLLAPQWLLLCWNWQMPFVLVCPITVTVSWLKVSHALGCDVLDQSAASPLPPGAVGHTSHLKHIICNTNAGHILAQSSRQKCAPAMPVVTSAADYYVLTVMTTCFRVQLATTTSSVPHLGARGAKTLLTQTSLRASAHSKHQYAGVQPSSWALPAACTSTTTVALWHC